jgi:hypothetical protein
MAAVAEVEATDEVGYESMEFPPAAAVEPPPVSSSQEVSTSASDLLAGGHGAHLAAAQAMCGTPEPAPALRTPARRPKRPERVPGSGGLGQQGDRRTSSCCWRSTGVSTELPMASVASYILNLSEALGHSRGCSG